jgi:uncharacterized protein YkwD
MHKKSSWTFPLFSLLLAACVTVTPGAAPTEAPPAFVTSTLPPTRPGVVLPTAIPPTLTETPDPLTPSPTSTDKASCGDSAILVEDVNYPDNTVVAAGQKFTKTWKLQNVGNCIWMDYTIAFVSGDRMSAPEAAPVPETGAGQPVDVSVNLVAPSSDGTYQGIFELRDADGKTIPIGIEPTFWVKIIVGAEGTSNGQGTPVVSQSGSCTYSTNDEFVQTLIDLINQARADVGRGTLTVNVQLMNAAQDHSLDMACNDFLEHSGSNGTWIGDRLEQVGYPHTYYLELLAIGLPQDALNQWRRDTMGWQALINSRVTEIGVGYVFSKFSSYGGYWTVNMGGP